MLAGCEMHLRTRFVWMELLNGAGLRELYQCVFNGGFIVKNGALLSLSLIACCLAPGLPLAADKMRQEIVAKRGADVMPFDLRATTHIFTKTRMGGIQRVIVKNSSDTVQIGLIRDHLRQITAQFSKGDFTGPTRIHGTAMPGLAELKAAQPGQIAIRYRELKTGAEIIYSSPNPGLVSALHRWFDAQLADHGHDAMAGHDHALDHSLIHPQ